MDGFVTFGTIQEVNVVICILLSFIYCRKTCISKVRCLYGMYFLISVIEVVVVVVDYYY